MKSNNESAKTWAVLPNDQIRHVWEKADDDSCESQLAPVTVGPDWYEQNGTPSCDCGQDMVYSHTEVRNKEVPDEADEPATSVDRLRKACELARGDCKNVLDAWEAGDLAGAVRSLNDTVTMLSEALKEVPDATPQS